MLWMFCPVWDILLDGHGCVRLDTFRGHFFIFGGVPVAGWVENPVILSSFFELRPILRDFPGPGRNSWLISPGNFQVSPGGYTLGSTNMSLAGMAGPGLSRCISYWKLGIFPASYVSENQRVIFKISGWYIQGFLEVEQTVRPWKKYYQPSQKERRSNN